MCSAFRLERVVHRCFLPDGTEAKEAVFFQFKEKITRARRIHEPKRKMEEEE